MRYVVFERALVVLLGLAVCAYAFRVDTENRKLASAIEDVAARSRGDLIIKAGARVPSLRGVDSSGSFRILGPEDRYLLITMNTRCAALTSNPTPWVRLTELARDRDVPLLWLSSDTALETERFLKEHGLVGDFLADVPFSVHVGLGMSAVPQILAVGNGTVTIVSAGPEEYESALAFVGTRLSYVDQQQR